MADALHSKPAIFVGSSAQALDIARAIEYNLQDHAETTLWNAGVLKLGQSYLESLLNSLDVFDFAIVVITPDDMLFSGDGSRMAPRDNVLFELGMFMGRLGRTRTFAVCSNSERLKLPSDLDGIAVARFQANRADRNWRAATGPACTDIREVVRRLGRVESKAFERLNSAAKQVEEVSENVSRLIALLARSRAVELEVIKAQFGGLLPDRFLEQIARDLVDLQRAVETRDQ